MLAVGSHVPWGIHAGFSLAKVPAIISELRRFITMYRFMWYKPCMILPLLKQ